MWIITDTREKDKHSSVLKFTHPWFTRWRIALEYGDYACMFKDGYAPPLIFERKALGDLFQTTGRGYKRFKKEIMKAQADGILLIIIVEGTLSDVRKGYKYSTRGGEEVVKQLFTLMVRHHIPFVCCSSRVEMAYYITNMFITVGNERFKKERPT